jgi:hypothetical protein
VVTEFDDAHGLALEDDDHAATKLCGWNSHESTLTENDVK